MEAGGEAEGHAERRGRGRGGGETESGGRERCHMLQLLDLGVHAECAN